MPDFIEGSIGSPVRRGGGPRDLIPEIPFDIDSVCGAIMRRERRAGTSNRSCVRLGRRYPQGGVRIGFPGRVAFRGRRNGRGGWGISRSALGAQIQGPGNRQRECRSLACPCSGAGMPTGTTRAAERDPIRGGCRYGRGVEDGSLGA